MDEKWKKVLAVAFVMTNMGMSQVSADSEEKMALEFLRQSVKERDQMLLEEIRKDQKEEQEQIQESVDSFLSTDTVEVSPLGLKVRPVSNKNAIEATVINYKRTGNIEPILANSDLILYPYGLSEPVSVCAPMRACHIQLQKGEKIIDTQVGDSQRWWVGFTFVGEGADVQPHVIIKPLVEDVIETSLSISTNKRLYYITIRSVLEGEYTKRIGFFYPDEHASKDMSLDGLKEKLLRYQKDNQYDPTSHLTSIDSLNFNYRIKGSRKKHFYPLRVFDDGNKVYIQMKESIQSFDLPVFMLIGHDKEYEAVNYRYHSPYYVVDRLFDRGVLLLTNGSSKEQKITIIRKENR